MKHLSRRGLWVFLSFVIYFHVTSPCLFASSKKASFRKTLRKVTRLKNRLAPILNEIEQKKEEIFKEWLLLAAIPAPSRQEEKRAVYIRKQFAAAGLDIQTDELGNLIGIRRGQGANRPKKVIVLCAHMDTVHGPEVALTFRQQGERVSGPGIYDDVSGLIGLLVTARLFQKVSAETPL